MSLTNKLITLTGAASGIGLSTARLLARRGALIALADYDKPNLEAAYKELSSLTKSSNLSSTTLDIRSTSSVNNWIENTTKHFKRPIDGCANIAGFHPLWTPKNVQDISDEEFEEVLSINTTGLFKCVRAQLKEGVFNPFGGSIVNVGSVSGLIGFAGDSPYVASKHATHGLTKSISKETGARNIRINAVAPGQTNTPMVHAMAAHKGVLPTPPVSLGREGQPEEVAELIVWLLGDESRYITGSVYRVDGGMVE
ncbi:3-oxoacyl-reductase [Zopfia rhizophila CBS 207.26]|uniref:3-oxoacyl-reductase n=1 Tax=Zopfia rhizophila CBS 207.26 TaxID=1314779 RepID=A0A6A6EAH2_9PEZI|nr:3-oxoacyl-reductase [Zopfia rhizophila CBS 207.26]